MVSSYYFLSPIINFRNKPMEQEQDRKSKDNQELTSFL